MESGIPVPTGGRGGPEHEYWKARVAQHLRDLGFLVEVEKPTGGGQTIDLVATKDGQTLAVEVETGTSDVAANIRKCIRFGCQRVLVLGTSAHAMHHISQSLRDLDTATPERVSVLDVQSFLEGDDLGITAPTS